MQFISSLIVFIALFSVFIYGFPSKIPFDASEWPNKLDTSLSLRSQRVSRSPQFYAEGGHGKSGTNLHIQGQTQLWQSENQRHQLFGRGGYGQHLGGPSGNSKPNFNAGLTYQFRF